MNNSCFSPIVYADSKTLILGSFPSIKSFENDFYYSNPQNQFWKILCDIYNMQATTKDEKIALLKTHKIALWDMAQSCERKNSADSNLKRIIINNIESFLDANKSISKIFFTGQTAQKLFNKHFSHIKIQAILLPSPSPAYAKMKYGDKVEIWRNLII